MSNALSFIKVHRHGQTAQDVQLNTMIERLREQVGQKTNQISAAHAGSLISMENFSEDAAREVSQVGQNLVASLESITNELFLDSKGKPLVSTEAQKASAILAGMYANNFKTHIGRGTNVNKTSDANTLVINSVVADGVEKRSFGLEAYDESENRNATVYSMSYNYQASRQDEFGETLWPTITLSNENVGFGITVNMMTVYDAIERRTSGTPTDFAKRNIIRAVKNPNILKKDQTKIVPVYRTGAAGVNSSAEFSTVVPPTNVVIEGESIQTGPLKFGRTIDIIGLSQTDKLLSTGVMNQSDTLDPAAKLEKIFVKAGDDILSFNVKDLEFSNFVAAPQDQYRTSNLNFRTVGLLIKPDTKQVDGSDLVSLAGVVTNNYVVTLEVYITGNTNVEFGRWEVYANKLAVSKIVDASKNVIDLTVGDGKTIADLFTKDSLDSYDLLAYRTNLNRRQQGQLIDVTKFTHLYNVPLRSPITSMHPMNNDGSTDASDVQALIATTRIRIQNDAVGELLSWFDTLRAVTDPSAGQDAGMALNCTGKYYVVPQTAYQELDMADVIDSIKSHERAADIQAVLVNAIRDMAYRLHRDSEYQAASDAVSGGTGKLPVVVVATDPVTGRYINVEGDLRTLSGGFDVRIVTTLDERMQGKIFVTFAVFDENRNVAPNPLNLGNLVWAPELVLSANISRSGISKETVVQPRYLFVPHLPVMGLIEVTGIPDVVNASVALSVDILSQPVTPPVGP